MTTLFLSADLMFPSRVQSAAKQLGTSLQIAPSPRDLAQRLTADHRLILIDLDSAGQDIATTVTTVRHLAPQATIIAFGSHVKEALLASAQAAGCHHVLSNGQFNQLYPQLLAQFDSPIA